MCKQTNFETCICKSQAGLELKLCMFIAMEIYVFVCTNIFLSFYLICITIMSHHFSTMDFIHLYIILKRFKIKISILFSIIFHKILYSYNNLFSSSESVSKGLKQPFIY
jgi:hypothetical protein